MADHTDLPAKPNIKPTNAARPPRARHANVTAAIVAAVLLGVQLTGLPAAGAQEINEAITFEDLGLTQFLNCGARAAGFGGAYNAAGEDVYSMIYNPAGLANIRRIETSLGFQHSQTDLTNVFYGNQNDVSSSATKLDALAAAYPMPTYRGSLVIAAGVFRVMSGDLELLNRGFNTNTDTYDHYLLQQNGSVYSYNFGVAADLSPAISLGASGFIMDGTIKALTQFSYENLHPIGNPPFQKEILVDDARADLDGYGAVVGVHYHPVSPLRIGISVATPIKVNLRGNATTETTYYFENAEDEFYRNQFALDTDYRIPFQVNGGVAVLTSAFTLSADAGYVDWRQAEINGLEIKDSDLNSIFRQTVNLRGGGELVLPLIPVRVRAGYAYVPFALEYLQADRIAGDQIQKAEIVTERQIYSGGIGVLLGRVLTIDASFEYQVGKRKIATLIDDRTAKRIVLTGSYRF